jgi:DNA gyrase subunit A
VRGVVTREQDVVRHILSCSSMDSLLFFTDRGKVYQLKAHEVPDSSRTSKGLALVNLISLEPQEQVTSMIAVPDFADGEYLVMATRRGKIKRTLLREYSQVRSNGLIAIGLEEGDELGWVAMSRGHEDILLTTTSGRTARFRQEDVRSVGRPASGVIGVNLNNSDSVVGMSLAHEGADLLVLTRKGFGKRTRLEEYPTKGRPTSGLITIKLRSEDDRVSAATVVSNKTLITIITAAGIVIRTGADGISRYGRHTQGVTVVNLDKGDYVSALAQEEPEDMAASGNGTDDDTEVRISPMDEEETSQSEMFESDNGAE